MDRPAVSSSAGRRDRARQSHRGDDGASQDTAIVVDSSASDYGSDIDIDGLSFDHPVLTGAPLADLHAGNPERIEHGDGRAPSRPGQQARGPVHSAPVRPQATSDQGSSRPDGSWARAEPSSPVAGSTSQRPGAGRAVSQRWPDHRSGRQSPSNSDRTTRYYPYSSPRARTNDGTARARPSGSSSRWWSEDGSNASSLRNVERGGNHSPRPIPRWQPDAEVTFCPICHAQFGWMTRKHHCRKCGRVVCNTCSPHFITIPNRYIVRPPGDDREPQQTSWQQGADPSSPPAGGERVRLCNPCVPDPNVAPPELPYHSGLPRSQTGMSAPLVTSSGPFPHQRALSENVDHQATTIQQLGGPGQTRQPSTLRFGEPRSRSSTHTGHVGVNYPGGTDDPMSILATSYNSRLSGAQVQPNIAAHTDFRPLPRPPRIAEEDECPICHNELPSNTLPDSESLRAAHITTCIENSLGGTAAASAPPGPSGSAMPQPGSSSMATDIPVATLPMLSAAQAPGASTHPSSNRPVRRSGVFPYTATEKDCVDDAECTICLENYEVGDDMGRLECFCRFHLHCIRDWFDKRPGLCPVHQYDAGWGV